MTVLERALLTEFGWDADLRHERLDGDLPTPNPGWVLVEVAACGVAHRDLIDRDGRIPFVNFPVAPGHEASGRVIAVGAGVTDWKVGDTVATMHRDSCGTCPRCLEGEETHCPNATHIFGLLADGGYARHIHAPARAFYAVPDDMDAALAACLNSTYGTAFRALNRYETLGPDVSTLVTGANGGVGIAALQIASRMGSPVTAVIRDGSHEEAVRANGATAVIVDDGSGFHKKLEDGPVDVVLDLVGQPTFNAAMRSLRQGGALGVVGNIVDARAEVNLGFVCVHDVRICGSSGASRRDLAALLDLHARAPFSLVVADRLPLVRADEGQRRLRQGGVVGRIVLEPALG